MVGHIPNSDFDVLLLRWQARDTGQDSPAHMIAHRLHTTAKRTGRLHGWEAERVRWAEALALAHACEDAAVRLGKMLETRWIEPDIHRAWEHDQALYIEAANDLFALLNQPAYEAPGV